MTPAGLEPAVPGPVGQCHIQVATNLLGLVRFQLSVQLGADLGPQGAVQYVGGAGVFSAAAIQV